MYDQLKAHTSEHIKLTDHQWAEIIPLFKPIEVTKGSYLIREGQTSNYIYFINSGLLRMFYLKDGEETTRYFATEGYFATALTSFLTRKPTVENVEALENCELLQLHFDDLQLLYKKVPLWETFFRQLLEEAYIITTKRIEGHITKTAQERYNDFVRYNPSLLQRVPQQYIATYLGITPVSLSRLRSKISKTK